MSASRPSGYRFRTSRPITTLASGPSARTRARATRPPVRARLREPADAPRACAAITVHVPPVLRHHPPRLRRRPRAPSMRTVQPGPAAIPGHAASVRMPAPQTPTPPVEPPEATAEQVAREVTLAPAATLASIAMARRATGEPAVRAPIRRSAARRLSARSVAVSRTFRARGLRGDGVLRAIADASRKVELGNCGNSAATCVNGFASGSVNRPRALKRSVPHRLSRQKRQSISTNDCSQTCENP
jgi:hypothetical protein